jgi:hypothetical protein
MVLFTDRINKIYSALFKIALSTILGIFIAFSRIAGKKSLMVSVRNQLGDP